MAHKRYGVGTKTQGYIGEVYASSPAEAKRLAPQLLMYDYSQNYKVPVKVWEIPKKVVVSFNVWAVLKKDKAFMKSVNANRKKYGFKAI